MLERKTFLRAIRIQLFVWTARNTNSGHKKGHMPIFIGPPNLATNLDLEFYGHF